MGNRPLTLFVLSDFHESLSSPCKLSVLRLGVSQAYVHRIASLARKLCTRSSYTAARQKTYWSYSDIEFALIEFARCGRISCRSFGTDFELVFCVNLVPIESSGESSVATPFFGMVLP